MRDEWILRRGSAGSGFRYLLASGKSVAATQRERIDALRIPPAWRDVHIAASPRAAVQAWGIDAKGRKQYRYHERAVQRGEQRKYYRVRRLARDLPAVRRELARLSRGRELTRDRVAAIAVRLLAQGFFRVGSERYARENRTFGLATLRKAHVHVEGDAVHFAYIGKRSKAQRQVVVDRELARAVAQLLDTPGPRLFRFITENKWSDLTAADINEFVRRISGVRYSAKDFRTWGGTLRLATVLADLGDAERERERARNVVLAIRLVSAELGNTPAICRKSYVHPIVIARYLDAGETIQPRATHASSRTAREAHTSEERALIAFLDRHFPERRRRVREEELAA